MNERIIKHLDENIEVRQNIKAELTETIIATATLIAAAFKNNHKLLVCGNGGSAADAQHIVAEFVSSLDHNRPRRAFPAIALTTDTSILTACANDFGYDYVFARQVEALGQPGDILLAISTSGNSKNVCRAVNAANKIGMSCISLTGRSGGKLKSECKLSLNISSENTQIIQEAHLTIEHMVCELVESMMLP